LVLLREGNVDRDSEMTTRGTRHVIGSCIYDLYARQTRQTRHMRSGISGPVDRVTEAVDVFKKSLENTAGANLVIDRWWERFVNAIGRTSSAHLLSQTKIAQA
jgi:hypothetical protein